MLIYHVMKLAREQAAREAEAKRLQEEEAKRAEEEQLSAHETETIKLSEEHHRIQEEKLHLAMVRIFNAR